MRIRFLLTNSQYPTRARTRAILRRRRLAFEELENRHMLAASPIGVPVTTPVPTTTVGPTVIGAVVVLTSSVLSPETAAPLVSSAASLNSPSVGGTSSTELPEILALGENSLAATELPDDTLSAMPPAWTPSSSGLMTPLSQAVGGMETRTESLEHGELGMLHPMSRSSHSKVSGANQPGGQNDPRDVDDTYNVIGGAPVGDGRL